MPGVDELKADISVRRKRVETLRDEVKRLTEVTDNNREKLEDVGELIKRVEGLSRAEKSLSNQLGIDRTADMVLLASLEKEEEDLNKKFGDVLSALEESSERQLALDQQLESARATVSDVESVIRETKAEMEKKVLRVESEESILESQEAELKILESLTGLTASVLAPRFVPISTEVTRTVFRLTSCPFCSLGFHCVNFMPTSCGHAYHPACLVALLAKSAEPKCVERNELFHPHWCESWGIDITEEHRQIWEAELGLQSQLDTFSQCIRNLFQKTPHVLSERRMEEKEKRQRFTLKYTATGVERSFAISIATTRVRTHVLAPNNQDTDVYMDDPSCRSTIRSSLTDEKEGEKCMITDVNVPLTRSKKGSKRMSTKGTDSTRKGDKWPLKDSPSTSDYFTLRSAGDLQMYHFFVETLKPYHTLEVWDKAGAELFNMSAQEFFEAYGQDVGKLHKFVCSHLASQMWGITVIRNPSFSGTQHVLSFSCSAHSSSTRLTQSSHASVGVVEVIHAARSRVDSESCVVSCRPSSPGLHTLKHLQSRVNDLGKDIADVISSIKLGSDEEEFAESLTDE
ncbi:hypothetical protein R1sor_008345 [Riccia sorocarpa]|uniref:RING-type domain-containing protein n=1 Tax=Riccia sorocarpa TaxID=122646 RepID=A0ABD3HWK2_9MARC